MWVGRGRLRTRMGPSWSLRARVRVYEVVDEGEVRDLEEAEVEGRE